MYKRYDVNIETASEKYRENIRKMFPQKEDIALEAYYNVLNARSHTFRQLTDGLDLKNVLVKDTLSDEVFEDMVEDEMEQIREKKQDYKSSMRLIKTARTLDEINLAVEYGYEALMMKVVPSEKIKVMYSLEQDLETGEIYLLQDSWEIYAHRENTKRLIDKMYYYPYQFPSPFAAYLIPSDLKVGERVILDDLIEDIVGASHKMHTYRLDSAEAIWDGKRFEIDHDSYSMDYTIG